MKVSLSRTNLRKSWGPRWVAASEDWMKDRSSLTRKYDNNIFYWQYFDKTFQPTISDGRIWRRSNTVRKIQREGGRRNSDSCLTKKEEWGNLVLFWSSIHFSNHRQFADFLFSVLEFFSLDQSYEFDCFNWIFNEKLMFNV